MVLMRSLKPFKTTYELWYLKLYNICQSENCKSKTIGLINDKYIDFSIKVSTAIVSKDTDVLVLLIHTFGL